MTEIMTGAEMPNKNDACSYGIPSLAVRGRTLPEVWEKSLKELWDKGVEMPTQYDREGDPPSKDCTMMITIEDPLSEPMIHRCLPAGFDELEKYRLEVVCGLTDFRVDPSDHHKWQYTYHGRLSAYPTNYPDQKELIPQIDIMIENIAKEPVTRRAQAITWVPRFDAKWHDPPCLQRMWCRMSFSKEKGCWLLNMNTHWRSRDAFKAAFMNMWAFISLQQEIAGRIADLRGEEVKIGRYVDVTDSYHIYGKDFRDPNLVMSFQSFLVSLENRTFEQRTIRSDDPIVRECFEEGASSLRHQIEEEE